MVDTDKNLVESLIAHLTLDKILVGRVRLTRTLVDSAVRLNKKLIKDFTDFIESPEFDKINFGNSIKDFVEVRDQIAKELDPDKLADSLGAVDNTEVAIELGSKTVAATQYLRGKMPRLPVRSRPSEVGDFIASEFMRTYRTVNDPLTTISDMKSGCLSNRQVVVVEEVYPDLYKLMVDSAVEAVANKLAKEPDFIMPYPKLKQLSVLMKQKLVPEDLKSVLQQSFTGAQADMDETKQSGPAPDVAKATATSVQKLDFDL